MYTLLINGYHFKWQFLTRNEGRITTSGDGDDGGGDVGGVYHDASLKRKMRMKKKRRNHHHTLYHNNHSNVYRNVRHCKSDGGDGGGVYDGDRQVLLRQLGRIAFLGEQVCLGHYFERMPM